MTDRVDLVANWHPPRAVHRCARPVRASAAALAVLLVAAAAAPSRVPAEVIDRLVAVVGTRAVTLSDLRAAVELGFVQAKEGEQGDAAVVRALVDRLLMQQEVARYGPGAPTEGEVERRLDEVRARLGAETLQGVMARRGLDEPRLRALVREDLELTRYLADRFAAAAQPTEEEVLQYYQQHLARFTRDGSAVPFLEAEPQARAALSAVRRDRLVQGWIQDLRRRGHVRILWP